MAGAVYGLVSGAPTVEARFRARVAKPAGVAYPAFEETICSLMGPEATVWKRQMVLGPDSEFLVNTPAVNLPRSLYEDSIEVGRLHVVDRGAWR